MRFSTPRGDLIWAEGRWTPPEGDEQLGDLLRGEEGEPVRLTETGPTVYASSATPEGAYLVAVRVLAAVWPDGGWELLTPPPAWPTAGYPEGAVA